MRKFLSLILLLVLTSWIGVDAIPLPTERSTISQNIPPQSAAIKASAMVGMTVANMERSLAFYTDTLNFQKITDRIVSGKNQDQIDNLKGVRKRIVSLQLGQEQIELTEYLNAKGRPIPIDARSNDLWFQHIAIVVNDMDKAFAILKRNKVQFVSTAPQTLPPSIPAAAGIKAFYFRDPDQHNLEIIYYPADKGDPRWQKPTKELFLGIDHTAIGIADTDSSLQLYRDILGLQVAGNSENLGTEQEHLNNVFGARLLITGLKSKAGMGIEFLDYLAPPGGRPTPADLRPNDLMHWQTTLVTDNLNALAQKLQSLKIPIISERVITLPKKELGYSQVMLVRDRDGHGLRIIQP